jgi:hypothetical protein
MVVNEWRGFHSTPRHYIFVNDVVHWNVYGCRNCIIMVLNHAFTAACYTHTSPMHYKWQEAQLSSRQISTMTDVPPIVCEPLECRQIKQLRQTYGFLSGCHLQVLYITGRRQYKLRVGENQRWMPQLLVYGNTRPSLLALFGVVRHQN